MLQEFLTKFLQKTDELTFSHFNKIKYLITDFGSNEGKSIRINELNGMFVRHKSV